MTPFARKKFPSMPWTKLFTTFGQTLDPQKNATMPKTKKEVLGKTFLTNHLWLLLPWTHIFNIDLTIKP
jgi:hypothetical protein